MAQGKRWYDNGSMVGKLPPRQTWPYKGEVTIDGVQIKNVGIRKKGFLGSLSNVRPSLKIKFQEYQKQQPIAGIDRLTLNNNQQDRSLASQFLGYHFFNQTGTIAPRCNHARITVNGNYLGIYTNVESVRPQLLKTRFGSSKGDLYEGTVADVFPDTLQRFELKTRETKIDPLRELARALEKTPLDLATLDTMIDIKSFVRYWATESLLGFWDGYTNNQNNFFVYIILATRNSTSCPGGSTPHSPAGCRFLRSLLESNPFTVSLPWQTSFTANRKFSNCIGIPYSHSSRTTGTKRHL
jgi:spore coat protein CotH